MPSSSISLYSLYCAHYERSRLNLAFASVPCSPGCDFSQRSVCHACTSQLLVSCKEPQCLRATGRSIPAAYCHDLGLALSLSRPINAPSAHTCVAQIHSPRACSTMSNVQHVNGQLTHSARHIVHSQRSSAKRHARLITAPTPAYPNHNEVQIYT